MLNPETPTKPETAPQQETGGGCQQEHCSPSSDTPENYIPYTKIPEEVHRAAQTMETYFDRQGMREWQFAGVADRRLVNVLEREVERWKKNIIPSLVVHAGNYGRDHYGEGCMHYTHFDMLAEAGGRMDDFKRCGAPSPENVKCGGTAAQDSQSEANEGRCPPLPRTTCSPS